MKKHIHLVVRHLSFLFLLFVKITLYSQTVAITANPAQSANAVIGLLAYHVSEQIYTDTEIGSTNFTSAATAINHIDFNVFTLGTPTTVTNYKIYFKEVPATTTVFTSSSDVYSTAGYTLVFSGTFNFNAVGWVGVDLTTTFTRTNGNNLQVLIERLDNTTHGSYNFNCTRAIDNGVFLNTSRRTNISTLPVSGTTVLNSLSSFRPQIQLRHTNANDAAVSTVYTMGKLPIPYGTPHIISANVINNGTSTLTNLTVNLNISGANSFSNSKIITSLAPGASSKVEFNAYNPTTLGFNTVSVSVPADDYITDNVLSVSQEVTNNSFNYAYGSIATNGVGLNGNTGDFVAMFTTNIPTSVNQVGVNFSAGGQPFRIGIWDKSGNGHPGTLLWESADQVSAAGVFTLPISPAVAITDTFYIGVRQIGTTNIQFSYQNETPIRTGTFYFTSPTGNTTWTDFAPSNSFKFMIEPRLIIANDVGVSSINNPVSATSIDNCGIVPQASVTNFGSANQITPFGVTFSIKQSGNTVYSDTKQVSLNSGETQIVNFTAFAGSISGNDSSFVVTSLGTDGATNNDTVINKFTTKNFSYSDSTNNSFGYSFANSTICADPAPLRPVYNWINETSNEINWGINGDDSILTTPVSIPFPFKFFGNNYSLFWICSNGWISFTNPTALPAATQRTPQNIPLAGGIENYIAGCFADLDVTNSTYADAHIYYGGDVNQFIITYKHAHLFGSASEYITFQIILKAGGDILVQYNDAESSVPAITNITNFCSAGIENSDGSKGILYRLNGSGGPIFGSPLALQYYTRPDPVTPVILVNFSAQKVNKVNKISWSTSQEINSNKFIIERSKDGRNFSAIGQVAAHGNSSSLINYSFNDNNPLAAVNYYRLGLTDLDNSTKYSSVCVVRNTENEEVIIFPNPVKDKIIIHLNVEKADRGTIAITDLSGKTIHMENISAVAGENQFTIKAGKLTTGFYLLKISLSKNNIGLVRKFDKL